MSPNSEPDKPCPPEPEEVSLGVTPATKRAIRYRLEQSKRLRYAAAYYQENRDAILARNKEKRRKP